MSKYEMAVTEALQILVDIAGRWGENEEEKFPRRIKAEDKNIDLANMIGNDDYTLADAAEIRDLWRAIEVIQEEFSKPIEAAPR